MTQSSRISVISKLLEDANKISQVKGTGNFVFTSPYLSRVFSGAIRKELRKEKIRLIFND